MHAKGGPCERASFMESPHSGTARFLSSSRVKAGANYSCGNSMAWNPRASSCDSRPSGACSIIINPRRTDRRDLACFLWARPLNSPDYYLGRYSIRTCSVDQQSTVTCHREYLCSFLLRHESCPVVTSIGLGGEDETIPNRQGSGG